jgi:hypothetical protein
LITIFDLSAGQVLERLAQIIDLEEKLEKALRWYTQSDSFSHFLLPVIHPVAASSSSSSGTPMMEVEPKFPTSDVDKKKKV